MGRQLFLHHYLPAHLASCLVTGALVEFVFNVEPVIDDLPPNTPISKAKSSQGHAPSIEKKVKRTFVSANERYAGQSMLATWAATGVILSLVLYGWWFFFPLTYGYPGLTVDQVNSRKWLGYDLHFAK
jgi:dolichyl-phosphate-mannose-protein mannosyltransferase